jgi:hypothetical protein
LNAVGIVGILQPTRISPMNERHDRAVERIRALGTISDLAPLNEDQMELLVELVSKEVRDIKGNGSITQERLERFPDRYRWTNEPAKDQT